MAMIVKSYNQEQFENTGVIAEVYPFGYDKGWVIVVYPGFVVIDGAASLSPENARCFSTAVQTAANIAEVNIGRKRKDKSLQSSDSTYTSL